MAPKKNTDDIVDNINRKIARLLGKKSTQDYATFKNKQNQKINNLAFSFLIIILILFLWCATGAYYVGEKQYGIILTNGSVVKVVKNSGFGFIWPYPFGEIQVIDAGESDPVPLTANRNLYTGLLNDGAWVKLDGMFNYQVINPILFYNTYPESITIPDFVRGFVQNALHQTLANKQYSDIKGFNLTVFSDKVLQESNNNLKRFGINLTHLNIDSIKLDIPTSAPLSDLNNKSMVVKESSSAAYSGGGANSQQDMGRIVDRRVVRERTF